MKRCVDLEARKYETEYLAASLITSQIWNAKLRDDPYYFYPHFLSFRFRKTKTDGHFVVLALKGLKSRGVHKQSYYI